jgi:hypothetical protein
MAFQDVQYRGRYGKIGISAVVAALHYQGEQHNTAESRFTPYDSD